MIYDVAILGGGASGMVSAIECARFGLNTLIVERNSRLGKKILVTGNGRCNLTNMDMDKKYFSTGDQEFLNYILDCYDSNKIIEFFNSVGLMTRNKNGLIYPLSNKAQSVLDCLRFAIAKYNINTELNFKINSLEKQDDIFTVVSENGKLIKSKTIIIACGLKAYDGTDIGTVLLKNFGHNIKPIYPALVQLKSNSKFINGLKGVKFIGKVTAVRNDEILASENGEILFTEYGVSGIAILQLSHIYSSFDFDMLKMVFDFLPDMKLDDIIYILEKRVDFLKKTNIKIEDLLIGFVDKKLGHKIIKYSGIENLLISVNDLTRRQILSIAKSLKEVNIDIIAHNGFKNAQACGGGADLKEFDFYTMESKYEKGLYAIGELLDVIGLCGGYNLHWAWATGMQAAKGVRKFYVENK